MSKYLAFGFAIVCGFVSLAKADLCDSPANLVANCGFETGDLTSWTTTGLPTWFGVSSFDAHSGNFGAFLAGFGSFHAGDTNFAIIGQDLATRPGHIYTLSYFWAHFTSTSPPVTPDNAFAAFVNGSQILSSTLIDVDNHTFEAFRYIFTAASATTNLQFAAEDANYFFSLDDVAVTPIPEPANVLLTLIGIAGLWALRAPPRSG